MCGIAGVLRKSAGDVETQLRVMLETVRHRGYSWFETFTAVNWGLGANRLEIVDAPNGRQPFQSNDGAITAVFNGEIYNHATLRKELQALGCRFRSQADTEVIAHGYRHWGEHLFARLDGMFAILIHDARNGTLIAARDPLGVKPLYSVANAQGEYFASEIKALLRMRGTVVEVAPGEVRFSGGHHHPYPLMPVEDIGIGSLTQNAKTLRELMSASIRKRVATEHKIAVFLSGGIDSAAVMYEAVNAHPDVTGFSIGLEDSSDVQAARRLCDELGMRHEHIAVRWEELLHVVPDVIWTIESFEPNHVRGGTLSYLLSRAVARAGYRIALCGEGADELFAGYPEVALALRTQQDEDVILEMLNRFVSELHGTQLQRIDRTSMRFALEMREPFLDRQIVAFARVLPLAHKLAFVAGGAIENKRVLRAAYRGILPDWVVDRSKTVLSLGAGFGSNGPEGPFYEHALSQMSEARFENIRRARPAFKLRNREEAYYFETFRNRFGPLLLATHRPLVNASPAEA
ncbi:MAG TPA: asparagine synthase-related protein [Polyangiaceae bacterium]